MCPEWTVCLGALGLVVVDDRRLSVQAKVDDLFAAQELGFER
jgi:hypothetical protein